jgi:hypothetical protein
VIRDPSDGSVKEGPMAGEIPVINPLYEQVKAALAAGKVKPERVSDQWAYQRAWNDGIDFSLGQIAKIFQPEGGENDATVQNR